MDIIPLFASIAQLVERLPCKQDVVGSKPAAGSNFVRPAKSRIARLVQLAETSDSNPEGFRFESGGGHQFCSILGV